MNCLQTSLTKSLESSLHVYGEKTAILIETGIPPLYLTQHVQMAQFRYRLQSGTHNTIPHALWSFWEPRLDLLPPTSMDRRMRGSARYTDPDRLLPGSSMPPNVSNALVANREKSYKRHLEARVTKLWLDSLRTSLKVSTAVDPPSRHATYLRLHLGDLSKRTSVYKPAHYLKHNHPAQLDLLRLRVQALYKAIPCHQYFPMGKDRPREEYQRRWCPKCLPAQQTGDEIHMILECPSTNPVWLKYVDKFKAQARLLDLPPFVRMKPQDQLSFALGNPPPSLLKKHYTAWIGSTIPVCSAFAGELRHYLNPLLAPATPPSRQSDTRVGDAPMGGPSGSRQDAAATPDDGSPHDVEDSEYSSLDDDTACQVCAREDDDSKMLLCDECNQGYHLYCLSPQLHQIPTGDWFCPGCQKTSQHVSDKDEPNEYEALRLGNIEKNKAILATLGIASAACARQISPEGESSKNPKRRHSPEGPARRSTRGKTANGGRQVATSRTPTPPLPTTGATLTPTPPLPTEGAHHQPPNN